MNPWIRRGLMAVALLGAVGGAAVTIGLERAEARMQRRIEMPPYPLEPRRDATALERGRYLFTTRGCVDCHGADGAGRTFVDDGGMRLRGPNISPGPGNVVAKYQGADWERTLRHGVKPDGRPLMIMPSEDYNRLTDDDLAALVGYVQSLPPKAGGPAELKLPLPVRVLYGFGQLPEAVERIDHRQPPAQPVPEGMTLEHGRYVAAMCIGCHGEHLSGGRVPGGPPSWPAAANLTPGSGSVMARYPDARALATMLRSGRRPDGSAIAVMPFESLRGLSDVDVGALRLFLASLPPRPQGQR